MAEIHLTDLIDVSVLQEMQDGFSKYTNMAALTTEADGTPVTVGSGFADFCMNLTRKSALGCKRCEECDKNGALETLKNGKPSVYNCHAGLVDFAAPIMVEGQFFGSVIGGQVRTEPVDETEMKKRAMELGIDPDIYIEAAKKTSLLEREEIERAAEFLSTLAKVLSEMALRNYRALEQSRKMEQAAKSQSEFIMDLSLNMKNSTDDYSLVDDAVEYIRMAGGELELMETEYNVREELQRLTASGEKYNGDQEKTIVRTISENVPERLLGDPGRIGQIIDKLLQYMLEHIQKGKILFEISCRKSSYATMLEIFLSSEDFLILPDEVKEIQKYFSKENIQATNADDSTGLSFSFVSILTRQLSGKVEVANLENGGIIFKVCLPQLEIRE